MAEVLITLGIIGIVAAMTLPSLIGRYQKKVLKEQFKVAYSLIQQAWGKIGADLGYIPECYYWKKARYSRVCVEYDDNGKCKKYTLPDGSPVPDDLFGRFNECNLFTDKIRQNLQVITICEGNAFQKGCIPDYEGYDTVLQANSDTDMSDEDAYNQSGGCSGLRKNELLNGSIVYVLKNGVILIPYSSNNFAMFTVDINGKKGPNKWGYDVFVFTTTINSGETFLTLDGLFCSLAEKGGLTTNQMIEQMHSK